jgi:hypothetical protein
MKTFQVLAIALLLVLLGLPLVQPAWADEEDRTLFGDRFHLTAGYRIWYAKWQSTLNGGSNSIERTTQFTPMTGPTITLSMRLLSGDWLNLVYGNFSMVHSTYRFENAGVGSPIVATQQDTADRRDISYVAGINIWKTISVFAGGYYSERRLAQTCTVGCIFPNGTRFNNVTQTFNGGVIGVNGSTAFSEWANLYGNFGFLIISGNGGGGSSSSTSNIKQSAHGWTNEVGFNFKTPIIAHTFQPSIQLGFKSTIISQDIAGSGTLTSNRTANDVTWGPVIQINATF